MTTALILLAAALAPQEAAAAKKQEGSPLEAYWEDGLRFRSLDGNFQAHVGGRVILHERTIFDRPDDTAPPLRSVPDSFFFRETYLEADALLYKEFGVKVQTDFRSATFNQSTGGAPSAIQGTLRDAFIEWRRWPEFRVRAGQFYMPISREDDTSFRFIDFAERSPMNRLLTGRETGVDFRGVLDDGLVTYTLVLGNGSSLLADQGRSVTDREDEKFHAGRLLVKPLRHSGSSWLEGFQVGLGWSIEDVDSLPVSGFDLATTELSVLYLDSTAAGTFDGLRTRLVPQFCWEFGPVLLQGEYLRRRDELDATFADDDIRSSGGYLYATWLLTGETKKPGARVVPADEWGAVELGLRFARVEVENAFEAALALPAGNSDEVTSITAGVNWWVRRFFRITLNVIREDYKGELAFDTRSEDALWGLIMRVQIDF